MFSHVLATLAGLALAAAPALARPVDGDEVTLKAGDKAPALSIESWIKGSPVAAFEPGKLYVVEFWATWCGPCIKGMPHLSEVQKHYREKGLTVIGVTSGDPNNPLEKVQAMVEQKGDGMAYTVAWDKERETHTAYMQAAQQRGIPCCFVVDGTGTVAYIGHPMWLDLVLDGVVAGTWDVVKGKEAVEKAEAELMAAFQSAQADPAKALELLEAFLATYPKLAAQFRGEKFSLLLAAGRLDEGYALARELVAEAMKSQDANMLLGIAA
jgi:thiol-disulfide isomerase/thioredoxin